MGCLLKDKESKLYVMKIIDMSRMDPKQRKDWTGSLCACAEKKRSEVRIPRPHDSPPLVRSFLKGSSSRMQ